MFAYRPGPYIDADGWSTFGSLAGDSTAYYISNQSGNDTTGNGSFALPWKTANKGMTQFNLLTKGRPHRLLFKAGDTWADDDFPGEVALGQYGRSSRELALISSYDASGNVPALTGARPLFDLPTDINNAGIRASGGLITSGFNYVGIVGLEFTCSKRDPDHINFVDDDSPGKPGIQTTNPYRYNLIEDCKFSFCQMGMALQGFGGFFSLRRNIINGNWTNVSHSQGIFANLFGFILLQENFLHHNGWAGTDGDVGAITDRNHNFYCDSDDKYLLSGSGDNGTFAGRLEAIGNVLSHPSANGIQCRPGGRLVDNLYLHCPLVGFVDGKERSSFEHNVALHGVDHSTLGVAPGTNAAGFQISNGMDSYTPPRPERGAHHSLAWNNIIAHDEATPTAPGFAFLVRAQNAEFIDNIVYNHGSSNLVMGTYGTQTGYTETTEVDEVGYPDAARTIYTYDTSIGGPGTVAHFLAGGLNRLPRTWNTAYTANAVNNYIRAGFGRAAITPVPKFHGTRTDGG